MKRPKQFFCLWKNTKGKLIEKQSDHVESLYYYEQRFEGVIYIDTRYQARLRLYKYLLNKTRIA